MNNPADVPPKITQLRSEIDEIDDRLCELLDRRFAIAEQVGEIKKSEGVATIDRPERETYIVKQACARLPNHPPESVSAIFREIIALSLRKEIGLKVAFLGPVGTHSQQALLNRFGQNIDAVACARIEDAFGAVERGDCDCAIIPIENSIAGSIGITLDTLLETSLNIRDEYNLPIHHCLLLHRDAGDLADIRALYSHNQSFFQCRRWIAQQMPHATLIECTSNGAAAQLAQQNPGSAAIAPESACGFYDLSLHAKNIEDVAGNVTRFIVVGKGDVAPSSDGEDKTSVIVSVKNEPGAMFRLLEPLAANGVNMTKFESRPAPKMPWPFYFFIDLDGHQQQPHIAEALAAVQAHCGFVKILGSYPKSHY